MLRGTLGAIAIAITIAAVAGLAAHFAPLLSRHADQDKCTFGPVSNEQYRAYLLDAQKLRPRWPTYTGDGRDIGAQLNRQLSDMLTPEATLYERVAKIHAILRAIGAEYLNTNARRDQDPFEAAHQRRDDVTFNYQVDINRLVVFQPWPRQLWLGAALRDPDLPSRDSTNQGDRIGAVLVSVVDRPGEGFLTASGDSCPPVPTAAEAQRYQNKK